jgi:hypothetical protein
VKICPNCRQTYSDETLNFCLSDGSVLNTVGQDSGGEATVLMGQVPPTNQNQTVTQPQANPVFQNSTPTLYQPNSQTSATVVQNRPPVKKSKAWLWIAGIVGGLVIVGGIAFIGLIGLVMSNIDDEPGNNSNVRKSPTPTVAFDTYLKDDFSKWRAESNSFGNTEFTNGEYIMSSKQAGFYYVLVTADKNFKTSNASTKVTVRSVTGKEARLGYGLLIHSDPNIALARDYAFLIDAVKQSYRVAQHTANKETTLINWTRFPAIRSGTQTNEIEVRDQNGKMSFFINGQFAVDVTDSTNFKDGLFGLYVSDAVPTAFSNLQIAK